MRRLLEAELKPAEAVEQRQRHEGLQPEQQTAQVRDQVRRDAPADEPRHDATGRHEAVNFVHQQDAQVELRRKAAAAVPELDRVRVQRGRHRGLPVEAFRERRPQRVQRRGADGVAAVLLRGQPPAGAGPRQVRGRLEADHPGRVLGLAYRGLLRPLGRPPVHHEPQASVTSLSLTSHSVTSLCDAVII